MSTTPRPKVGFIRPGATIPADVNEGVPPGVDAEHITMNAAAMDFSRGTSYEANLPLLGKKQLYIDRVPREVKERGWQAVAIGGWPVQMQNPGLLEDVQAVAGVPVTTDAHSAAAALKALGAGRILIMTPWDETVDAPIRAYLASQGVEAVSPASKPYKTIAEGLATPPDQLRALTALAVRDNPVEGIYFQAPMATNHPLLEEMEKDLGVPIVTMGTANLWYMLAALGLRYQVSGHTRLLSEWPGLPSG